MATFFIHTTLPLAEEHRAIFAQHHAESTGGNQLAVINNADDTECLVKVNCNHAPQDIIPADLTPIDIVMSVEEARAILATPAWVKPLPV